MAAARPGEEQCRVLTEDRGLEVLELRAGFDPELFDERRPGGAIRLQGIGLPFGAVEREHQLPAEPLAERLLCNQRLELRDEVGMAAEEEIGVDALFEGSLAQLLEPADLGLGERLVGEIGERRPAPQAEGFPEDRRRRLLVPHRAGGPRLGEQVLEASGVHGHVPVDGVAGIAGDDDPAPSSLRSCETALWSDASAVRGASAPQMSSTSRSIATVSPAAKREERE